jgi:hypothetical protein
MHKWQVNKVDKLPFHNHPISVAKVIASFLNTDLELIEAWLAHDVIEDCDNWEKEILKNLWKEVLDLVRGVTEIDKSNTWEDRKKAYLDHLSSANTKVLIVSLADHIQNLHRIIWEYIELWEKLWINFWSSKDRKIKYFYDYANILTWLLEKNNIWDYSKVFKDMFTEYVIVLDFFWDITQKEINTNIDFDYDSFLKYYNEYALKNGWYKYEVNKNTQFLIFDYVISSELSIKTFAENMYKNEQEY